MENSERDGNTRSPDLPLASKSDNNQTVRKTVYGLQTSAQETVLALRLTIPIHTIRDENLSLSFSCYNQGKREALCWLFSVFKGWDQVPDCEDAVC